MMMLSNAGWHVCAPLVSGWPRLPAAERLVSRHSPASGVTLPHPPQSVSVLSPSHRPYPEIMKQVNWWQFVNNNCDNSVWSVLEDDLWGSRHQFKHSLLVKYFTVNLVVNGNFFVVRYLNVTQGTSYLEKQNEIRVRNRDPNIEPRASLVMNKQKYLWIILFQFYV